MFSHNNSSCNKYFLETNTIKNKSLRRFQETVDIERKREEVIDKVFDKKKTKTGTDDQDHEPSISEIQLAADLKTERRMHFLEEKRRQQLRENNHELKELERKLRSAYISKALAVQKSERELIRAEEKAQKHKENEVLEKARISYAENSKLKEQDLQQQKHQLRLELQQQMLHTNQEKAKKYQEFLEEKKIVDDIVKKIYQEQMEEMEEKLHRKLQIKADMEEFFKTREIWKKEMEQNNDDETKQIEELIKQREAQSKKLKKDKEILMQQKEEISEHIGRKISAIEDEKRKRTALLEDLLIEERKARDDDIHRKDLEQKLRDRIQTRLELDEMREDNIRRLYEEQEDDRKYREELMQQLAERDKLEQLSNEKRRRKMMEHKRATDESLAQKKQRHAEELAALIKQRELDIGDAQRKQQLVEEERMKMLQEHAMGLLGFFPPGVLRESDREFLPLPPKSFN